MNYVRYANQGAIRNQPINDRLMGALSFLPELGVEMEVFSGGQAAKGSGGARTGSTRHDHGNAADVFFYKDGRKLDWANPQDRPIFEEIVRRARANGVTGIGAGDGYMQPGSMHIGFGNEAVWGAGGKGENAPDWLRAAWSGAEGVASDTMAALGIQQAPQNALSGPSATPFNPTPQNALSQRQEPPMPRLSNALDPRAFMTRARPANKLSFT
ncbi:hypothetical protein [Roseovarius sp. MMSF_3350]|uniref:hypothetical protein n=1 Tax=Roseovarius sp. MMSF_3350 TaxID=3046706 RepID=UPI00273DE6F0|nr:hypothetical protein [Roseovarius sp. MMSF_3350]